MIGGVVDDDAPRVVAVVDDDDDVLVVAPLYMDQFQFCYHLGCVSVLKLVGNLQMNLSFLHPYVYFCR